MKVILNCVKKDKTHNACYDIIIYDEEIIVETINNTVHGKHTNHRKIEYLQKGKP